VLLPHPPSRVSTPKVIVTVLHCVCRGLPDCLRDPSTCHLWACFGIQLSFYMLHCPTNGHACFSQSSPTRLSHSSSDFIAGLCYGNTDTLLYIKTSCQENGFMVKATGKPGVWSREFNGQQFWFHFWHWTWRIQQFQYTFGFSQKQTYQFQQTFSFAGCESDIWWSLKISHQLRQSRHLTLDTCSWCTPQNLLKHCSMVYLHPT